MITAYGEYKTDTGIQRLNTVGVDVNTVLMEINAWHRDYMLSWAWIITGKGQRKKLTLEKDVWILDPNKKPTSSPHPEPLSMLHSHRSSASQPSTTAKAVTVAQQEPHAKNRTRPVALSPERPELPDVKRELHVACLPELPESENTPVSESAPSEKKRENDTTAFEAKLSALDASKSPLLRRAASVVREMVNNGITELTAYDWKRRTGMKDNDYQSCREALLRHRVIVRVRTLPGTRYRRRSILYRFDFSAALEAPIPTYRQGTTALPLLDPDDFWCRVNKLENSVSENGRRTAITVRQMIDERKYSFTKKDWVDRTGMSNEQYNLCRHILTVHKLAVNLPYTKCRRYRGQSQYVFTLKDPGIEVIMHGEATVDAKPHSHIEVVLGAVLSHTEFWARVDALEQSGTTALRQSASVIKEMIGKDMLVFTDSDWLSISGMSKDRFDISKATLFKNNLIARIYDQTDPYKRKRFVSRRWYRFTLIAPPDTTPDITQPETIKENPTCTQPEALITSPVKKMDRYLPLLKEISPLSPINDFHDKVSRFLSKEVYRFSAEKWAAEHHLSLDESNRECLLLMQMGLLSRTSKGKEQFFFRFDSAQELKELIDKGRIHAPNTSNLDFWTNLAELEGSKSELLRDGAEYVRELISAGTMVFTALLWMDRFKVTHYEFQKICRGLVNNHIAEDISPEKGTGPNWLGVYRLLHIPTKGSVTAGSSDAATAHPSENETSIDISSFISVTTPSELSAETKTMINAFTKSRIAAEKRVGLYLKKLFREGKTVFTFSDYCRAHDLYESVLGTDMTMAVNRGLLTRFHSLRTSLFRVNKDVVKGVKSEDLGDVKKKILRQLYEAFGTDWFIGKQITAVTGIIDYAYRINDYVNRGILEKEFIPGRNRFRLLITPKTHPECFLPSNAPINKE